MMPANLREESKETNGTWVDADEMQRSMTSEGGGAMERQRLWRMNNVKFIPVLYPVHLTSLSFPRVETALHQQKMSFLHFPRVT